MGNYNYKHQDSALKSTDSTPVPIMKTTESKLPNSVKQTKGQVELLTYLDINIGKLQSAIIQKMIESRIMRTSKMSDSVPAVLNRQNIDTKIIKQKVTVSASKESKPYESINRTRTKESKPDFKDSTPFCFHLILTAMDKLPPPSTVRIDSWTPNLF